MNASGQTADTSLNLTLTEYVSAASVTIASASIAMLGFKVLGQAIVEMRKPATRDNPYVNAHHVRGYLRDGHRVAGYHMPAHHARSPRR